MEVYYARDRNDDEQAENLIDVVDWIKEQHRDNPEEAALCYNEPKLQENPVDFRMSHYHCRDCGRSWEKTENPDTPHKVPQYE